MKRGELLSKMIAHAAVAHQGQLDRGGKPYILHVLKVLHNIGNTYDLEFQCIAIGHDLFEDTKTSEEDLRNLGCSDRVIEGIYGVTKMPGESYSQYKEKVKLSLDRILVKMADIRHNTDIRRLKGVTQKDLDRQARYQEFYAELEAEKNQFTS